MTTWQEADGTYANPERELIGELERVKSYCVWSTPMISQVGVRLRTGEKTFHYYDDLRHARSDGWIQKLDVEPRGRVIE